MVAFAIITLAGTHGVTLTADATRIIARPASALTDELRQAIRNHKIALLRILEDDDRSTSADSGTGLDRHPMTASGDKLVCHAPKGTMTHEIRAVIRIYKPALMRLLSRQAA
jgi:TubC N-terminal docking domain